MSGFRELIVWQRADEMAYQIYRLSRSFPKDELYGMTSQIRRAAVSVAANIAEGSGRHHRNETKQFLNVALGSLAELDSLWSFAKRLEFMTEKEFQIAESLRKEFGFLLAKLYNSF